MGYYCYECGNSKSVYNMGSLEEGYDECKESGYEYYCKYRCEAVHRMGHCESYTDGVEEVSTICYITTAAHNVLDTEYSKKYLSVLRNFREKKMRSDPKYHKLLLLYDIVGPKIAQALREDEDKIEISKVIMLMVRKACGLLDEGKTEQALRLYANLTVTLADYYGIEIPEITDEFVSTVDISMSGTGVVKIKEPR